MDTAPLMELNLPTWEGGSAHAGMTQKNAMAAMASEKRNFKIPVIMTPTTRPCTRQVTFDYDAAISR